MGTIDPVFMTDKNTSVLYLLLDRSAARRFISSFFLYVGCFLFGDERFRSCEPSSKSDSTNLSMCIFVWDGREQKVHSSHCQLASEGQNDHRSQFQTWGTTKPKKRKKDSFLLWRPLPENDRKTFFKLSQHQACLGFTRWETCFRLNLPRTVSCLADYNSSLTGRMWTTKIRQLALDRFTVLIPMVGSLQLRLCLIHAGANVSAVK